MKFPSILLVGSSALGLVLGCTAEAPAPISTASPVVLAAVTVRDLEDRIEATGELQAKEDAQIASEIAGRVTSLAADEGQRVEEGEVLLEIDPERRQLELANVQAGMTEAQASFAEQKREAARVESLHLQDIASESRLDQAQTKLALARSRQEAARAQLGVARRALRDASVRAPFSGLVARRQVSRGEFVSVGQVLFQLVALDPIEVEFHVPERDSARVAPGQTVHAQVAPYPGEAFAGEVTVISPTIDAKTRTLRVKAQIDNADGRLRPGLFARVDLGVARRSDVLLIPEEAVLQRADGQVVFRTKGEGADRVERVLIETGSHRDGLVEITRGLLGDDWVVARGQAGLVDGAAISSRNSDGSVVSPARTNLSAAPMKEKALP